MKKQHRAQLLFFTDGLLKRYRENGEYFQRADAAFRSGRKSFEARLEPHGGGWQLSYNGQKQEKSPEDFLSWFADEAMKYEEAVLRYTERGAALCLEADDRGVRFRQSDGGAERREPPACAPTLSERQYAIRVQDAPELLRAIGVLTDDGKLRNDKIRKYNQIDHFVELIGPILEADPAETVTVLDCACGKSYLGFALNYYIREVLHRKCRITGVDRSARVIGESRRIALQLGYRNMEFVEADLRTYRAEKPSVVLSLHACDTATDMAIGLAVRAGARAIACVPCCHKELLDQYRLPELDAVLRHGVFRARLNDILTDGLRTLKLESLGYRVRAVEYISPLDTPKNLLLLAEKTADGNAEAREEYDALRKRLGVLPAIERECAPLPDEPEVTASGG